MLHFFCKRWNKHVFLLTYYFKDYVLSPCMMKSISYKCGCIMEFLVHFGKHFGSSFFDIMLFPPYLRNCLILYQGILFYGSSNFSRQEQPMQILVSMPCKPRFYFLPGPWLQYLLSILHSFCSPIRRLLASTCLGPEHRSIMLPVFSGKDNLLPSGEEADRLFKALKNCRVRYFKDNGHTLLLVQSITLNSSPVIPISLSDYTYMYVCKRQCISSAIIFVPAQEDGVNLLTVIKGANMYRRGRQRDSVTDYLPPTLSEFRQTFDVDHR